MHKMILVNEDADLDAVMALINAAGDAMLYRMNVTVHHPAGWKRPDNWPLPAVKEHPGPDGVTVQTYRPLAVLEWCEYKLAEPERQARAAKMHEGRAA